MCKRLSGIVMLALLVAAAAVPPTAFAGGHSKPQPKIVWGE